MQRYTVTNFNEILQIILFLIIKNTYELNEKYKLIYANKYIQLTKYDKNIQRNTEW